MTVVLVHGNPETAVVWDPLVERLGALGVPDPVRLSPPGFGAPTPDGWGATILEYRDWLIAELEAIGHPVDLVGHDWGGLHVVNAVMARPELVRTWCSDAVGAFDQDYVWHEFARRWQTPGEGEALVAAMIAGANEPAFAEPYLREGLDRATAERMLPAIDETMGECMLRLYRSAAQPVLATLGAGLEAAAARPGLAVTPALEAAGASGTSEQQRRAARRAGARTAVLDGLRHWWITQDPDRAAHVLTDFWRSV